MAAYLGKISAVIAANTQDFTRKLSTAKGDIADFQRRLNGIRLNLDISALDRTLTAVQRMQRTFQEARKLKIDTSDLQRMYRLFEDVGRPLTSVKNQIEGMSYAVQAQLYPALGKAQKGFQDLYNFVKSGGKATRAEVDNLRAQIERLNASVAVVKGISSLNDAISGGAAGPTFVQARAEEAMRRAAAARAAAAKLPGSVREDSFFQRLVGETASAGNEITRLTAKVEKFKLELANNPGLAGNPKFMSSFANAQSQLDGVIDRLEKLNAMSSGRVGNISIAGALTDRAREMLPAKDATRQQILQNYRDDIRGIALSGGSYAEQKADRAEAIARTRAALNADAFVSGPAERAKGLIDRAGATKDAGLIAGAEAMRKLAIDTQSATGNTAQFTAKMQALTAVMDGFETKLAVVEKSGKQFSMFLEAAGRRSDKLGAAATRAASDMRVVAQFKGNFPAERVVERGQLGLKEMEAEKRIQQLLALRQKAEANSKITDENRVRAYQKIDQLILQQTKHLLQQTAVLSGGAFTEDQVNAAADRAAKNTGSMGMGRFAGADLAFQQAAFAIDDLMSATGGLEYKIRAVSNNITQMGLMLGQSGLIKGLTATKGLFIGLGAVMAGQLAVQLMKHSKWYQEYQKRGEVLNDLLDQQRAKAKSAAEAFGALADAIRDAVMSESGSAGAGRRRMVADVVRAGRESAESRIAMQDPAYAANLSRQAALRERQKNSKDAAEIAGIEQLIRDLQAQAPGLRRQALDQTLFRVRQGLEADRVGQGAGLGALLNDIERRGIEARVASEAYAAGSGPAAAAAAARGRRDAAQIDPNRRFENAEDALKAFEAELSKMASIQADNAGMTGSPLAFRLAGERIAELEKVIASLKAEIDEKAFEALARSVYAAADDIEAAQKRLAGAVEAGVPMARTLQAEMDSLAEEMNASLSEAKRLREENNEAGAREAERRAKEIADRRDDVVLRARAAGRAAELNPLAFARGAADAQAAQAETLLSRTFVKALEDNFAIQKELDRRAGVTKNPADIQAAERFNDELRDLSARMLQATQASNEFGRAIEKFATALGSTVVGEMESERDRARREVNRASVEGGRLFLGAQRDELAISGAAQRAEAQNLELQQRYERRRQEFETGVFFGNGNPDDVARARRINELEVQANNENLNQFERLRAKQEAERLRAEQRAAFENSPVGIALRAEADRIDQGAQAAMLEVERQRRGRELVMSDADRRREEVTSKALDAAAAIDEFAFGGERKAAAQQAFANLARDVAPMVVGFGEEVMNARLQGPSRQALNASDATTMEGQRELNRLIRGDDASKDVNLVELQKQTAALETVVRVLEQQAVVDL